MYTFGELDDQVHDLVDHDDAVKIAQAVLDYLDDYEAGNEDAHLRLPPLSVKDMRATITDIIEKQAQMLLEEL
jgi:cobalamin biosynthesis Co2+ chelatase CbiK